eukprot:g7192.t1
MGFAQGNPSTKAPGDGGVASLNKQKITVLTRLKFSKGSGELIEANGALMDAFSHGVADGLSDFGFGASTRTYLDMFLNLPGGKLFNMATASLGRSGEDQSSPRSAFSNFIKIRLCKVMSL